MRRTRRALVAERGSLMVDYVAVASALVVDAATAEVQAINAPQAFERRGYARALFAFIEGVTYCQRRLAEHDIRLTAAARARAKAAAKQARRTGRKSGERESVALAVRSAFAAMAAAHQVSNPLVPVGSGWQCFRKGIAVRNRVTHPKSGQDCEVSEADVAVLREAHHWYYAASSALLERLRGGRDAVAQGDEADEA